jgi:hypothetical protein
MENLGGGKSGRQFTLSGAYGGLDRLVLVAAAAEREDAEHER